MAARGQEPGGVGRSIARLLRRGAWWGLDYAYVVGRQAEVLNRRRIEDLSAAVPLRPPAVPQLPAVPTQRAAGDADAPVRPYGVPPGDARSPDDGSDAPRPGPAPVVLVPGVYESWTFLRPLALVLARQGHPVHVLPTLGYNRGPVAAAAIDLGRLVADQGLDRAVVLAHSKGGLIGKQAMLTEDPGGRITGMVTVATPFGGSEYARWVPLRAVRAFAPDDAVLRALAAERAVNARIVSVYSRFDPHIPAGSVLEGAAANIELATPGHFRVLTDRRLPGLVLRWVRRLAEASR